MEVNRKQRKEVVRFNSFLFFRSLGFENFDDIQFLKFKVLSQWRRSSSNVKVNFNENLYNVIYIIIVLFFFN